MYTGFAIFTIFSILLRARSDRPAGAVVEHHHAGLSRASAARSLVRQPDRILTDAFPGGHSAGRRLGHHGIAA